MRNLTLILSILSSLLFAQKPAEVSIKFRDGNTMTGSTTLPDINLVTSYGTLVIPVKNVTSIKMGLSSDKTTTEKTITYLKQLGGSSEELKKAAYGEIIKMGIKAISAISDFNTDPKNVFEYSGEYTPDNALAELKSMYNIDESTGSNDIVSIDGEYTMGGVFEFNKIEVKTEYGTLNVTKDKIKSIDILFISDGNNNDFTFKLNASKNISGNQNGGWMKTGIMLKQGQKFTIISSGEITLASLSNQKYHPDGSYETANGEKYNNGTTEDYASTNTYPAYGNVVYRVGENTTQLLKAGAKFSGTAPSSGLLYLSIYETVYNAANSGSYTVKVILK